MAHAGVTVSPLGKRLISWSSGFYTTQLSYSTHAPSASDPQTWRRCCVPEALVLSTCTPHGHRLCLSTRSPHPVLRLWVHLNSLGERHLTVGAFVTKFV